MHPLRPARVVSSGLGLYIAHVHHVPKQFARVGLWDQSPEMSRQADVESGDVVTGVVFSARPPKEKVPKARWLC
jgi:hypothetical protein